MPDMKSKRDELLIHFQSQSTCRYAHFHFIRNENNKKYLYLDDNIIKYFAFWELQKTTTPTNTNNMHNII